MEASSPKGLGRAGSAVKAREEDAAIRKAAADIAAEAFAAGEAARKLREQQMAQQHMAQQLAAQQLAAQQLAAQQLAAQQLAAQQVPAMSPTQHFNALFESEVQQRQQLVMSGQITAAKMQEEVRQHDVSVLFHPLAGAGLCAGGAPPSVQAGGARADVANAGQWIATCTQLVTSWRKHKTLLH